MSNRPATLALLGAPILAAFGPSPATAADWPPGAARERPLVLQERSEVEVDRYRRSSAQPRPYARPINGGPGYVGSDYGLGKPAFTGLGSRPDWGYSE